ncbi:nuclear cap-binding protein subunit 2 [Heracleum sosnowskyi]|uniref:Nuclear cap-binding protein subunit 2 n=1 Tax=Heracleum sosnowskyi TaxID=360622 RepID=A0AAD8GNV0_9APIA|nr:nuclear cap-binding protein subunit 2 [Heracleum sosnowskyi]
MALYTSHCQSPISSLQFHKKIAFTPPKPLISTIPISQNIKISVQLKHKLQIPSCSISSNDEVSPSSIVLVKGLPLSILEGRLKTAFAQFGEVCRVIILKDKKTRKPFGSAYVWFACSEEAELAAKEMNGKFLDGRFISVRITIPGSCKSQVKGTPYKF